jgi:hypothetical protein
MKDYEPPPILQMEALEIGSVKRKRKKKFEDA